MQNRTKRDATEATSPLWHSARSPLSGTFDRTLTHWRRFRVGPRSPRVVLFDEAIVIEALERKPIADLANIIVRALHMEGRANEA